MSSIGDKPASEMTYREWLIGQALSGSISDPERGATYESFGEDCIRHVEAVLEIMDERYPNLIPLDFTAVKDDGKDVPGV